jgi:hypothetical protein
MVCLRGTPQWRILLECLESTLHMSILLVDTLANSYTAYHVSFVIDLRAECYASDLLSLSFSTKCLYSSLAKVLLLCLRDSPLYGISTYTI